MATLDWDDYLATTAEYISRMLEAQGVEMNHSDAAELKGMLHHGLEQVRWYGEPWELVFLGAIEVLMERALYNAHPGFSLPARLSYEFSTGRLHEEDKAFVDRVSEARAVGGSVALFSICPLWPFC